MTQSAAFAHGLFSQAVEAHGGGRLADAEWLYRQVLAVEPTHAGAIHGMGGLAFDRGQDQAAAEFLSIALEIEPDRVTAMVLLGSTLMRLGHVADALGRFDRALALQPGYALAQYERGWALWGLGRRGEGLTAFEGALALDPHLANSLSTKMLASLQACDWSGLAELEAWIDRETVPPLHPSTAFFYSASATTAHRLARRFASCFHPAKRPLWTGELYDHSRIRIAYVGGDFGDHPVGRHLVGVLEAHDRSRFEIVGVSHGASSDAPIRARLAEACDLFVDASDESDEQIARRLRDFEADIVVAVSGYTEHGRPDVLAWRPAPVQVSYLGYPGGLGADYIDYLIADRHTVPPEAQGDFSERIARLPDVYHPTDDKETVGGDPTSRAAHGLPDDAIVFMAYGQAQKIRPPMFDSWMRILMAVPGSVLWLSDNDQAVTTALRRAAAARGVDPARLAFAGRVKDRSDHLERHRLADLYLDTSPHNAHASACDALWMGVPVITLRGETFCSRVGSGLLSAAGLPDLITERPRDYEALAVALARDRSRLKDIRLRVEAEVRQAPLFQTARHARHLEDAFEAMASRARAGLAPKSFDVEPRSAQP